MTSFVALRGTISFAVGLARMSSSSVRARIVQTADEESTSSWVFSATIRSGVGQAQISRLGSSEVQVRTGFSAVEAPIGLTEAGGMTSPAAA
jgi:hypothetical protein